VTTPEPIHPVDELLDEITLQRQRVLRSSAIDLSDELAFRLYPLLTRIVETLADCVDMAIDEATETNGSVPLSRALASRTILVLGRLLEEVTRCVNEQQPRTTSQTAHALSEEAKQIVLELVSLFGGDVQSVETKMDAEQAPAIAETTTADTTPTGIFAEGQDDV
jgi:hypothetical protein